MNQTDNYLQGGKLDLPFYAGATTSDPCQVCHVDIKESLLALDYIIYWLRRGPFLSIETLSLVTWAADLCAVPIGVKIELCALAFALLLCPVPNLAATVCPLQVPPKSSILMDDFGVPPF